MNKEQRKSNAAEKDNYIYCEDCISRTKGTEGFVMPVLVKLPLYIYPPKGSSVLMGYVYKCPVCFKNYAFIWKKGPNRYMSDRTKSMLKEANKGKYTKGLTEAELCSPAPFKVREDDDNIISYARRFNNLLKQYAK